MQRILSTYPKSSVTADAQKLNDEIQSRLGLANFKIGVILPLTGSFARFGEAALNGISCAIGLFDPCNSPLSKAQIVVKDTEGDPAIAAAVVKELVEKEKVSAILGPLLSSEAAGAAAQAQALLVPMIVLAPEEGVTNNGDYIFQHSLLPENEMAGLMNQISKLEIKKFILIYPKNRYGEEYRDLFLAGLQNGGLGKIIATAPYAPDIPDFIGIIGRLKIQSGDAVKKVGIFIPDSYKQVLQITQSLDNLEMVGPKLIGTSRWYHPQLLAEPSPSLEGALFDTPFYEAATRETTRQFSDDFYKAFGSTPAWLEAFGFDATHFILQAFTTKGSDKPLAIREGLLTLQNYPSTIGPVSWSEKRITKWPLDFLTIQDGKFVLVNPQ